MRHVKNPLTVISIFAGTVEVTGTAVLPLIEAQNQATFIWFLLVFPFFLVSSFFLTLNFNHRVLYAPSDYKDENNFLISIKEASPDQQRKKAQEELKEFHENYEEKEFKVASTLQDNNLMSQMEMAEKLAIFSLSKSENLEFRRHVNLKDTTGDKWVQFDALAVREQFHIQAAEIKLFNYANFQVSRFKSILEKSELLYKQYKLAGAPDLTLHLFAINNTYEIKNSELKTSIEALAEKYDIKTKVHVVNFNDLINEWQYGA